MIFFLLRRMRARASSSSREPHMIEVPAHGFVVGSDGLVKDRRTGPIRMWFRKFIGACAMASAIAAGLMVYMHFTKKWKQAGFPVIPISALAQIEQANTSQPQAPTSGAVPLTQGTSGIYQGGRQEKNTSFLDNLDFEG